MTTSRGENAGTHQSCDSVVDPPSSRSARVKTPPAAGDTTQAVELAFVWRQEFVPKKALSQIAVKVTNEDVSVARINVLYEL